MENYQLGFSSPTDTYSYKAKKGLSETVVREISQQKHEPSWMLDLRLTALTQYLTMPTPQWGADLNAINWDDIHYYLKPVERAYQKWDDIPNSVRQVFDA